MKNKFKLVLIVLFLSALVAIVFGKSLMKSRINNFEKVSSKTTPSCVREDNCCVTNEDCKYIWYTGSCNTPEYVTKVQKEAEAQRIRNGEAPFRKDVTCACESNKCVTHN